MRFVKNEYNHYTDSITGLVIKKWVNWEVYNKQQQLEFSGTLNECKAYCKKQPARID